MRWSNQFVRVESNGTRLDARFAQDVPVLNGSLAKAGQHLASGPDTELAHLQVLTLAALMASQGPT